MTVQAGTSVARFAAASAVVLIVSITVPPALAQSSDLLGAADSLVQMEAEDAWLILRERRVYDGRGRWIGRFISVRGTPDGSIAALLQTRPRYGWRRYLIPLSQVSHRNGRVVLTRPLPKRT